MATIASALLAGVIHEYRLPAHAGSEPVRPLYLADQFYDWVDQTDALHEPNYKGRRSRWEHLEQALIEFRCASRPLVGDLNRVMPNKKGLWKIHASGVRLFGWVPAPHAFVGVRGALIEHTHGPGNIVDDVVDDVIDFAKKHGLYSTFHWGDRSALFSTPT